MTELLVDVGVLVVVATLLVVGLAVWRIGRVASWRALAMTAWATHSFTECVAFIRFCVEEQELMTERPLHGQQRGQA